MKVYLIGKKVKFFNIAEASLFKVTGRVERRTFLR